jgi:hypothetical protein
VGLQAELLQLVLQSLLRLLLLLLLIKTRQTFKRDVRA